MRVKFANLGVARQRATARKVAAMRSQIILDSGAWPTITRQQLADEHPTTFVVGTASAENDMSPEAEGVYRSPGGVEYGKGLRCSQTSDTLLSVKEVALQTGIGMMFEAVRAIAIDTKSSLWQSFVKKAIRQGIAAVIGEADENWVHTLTDQQALDELVMRRSAARRGKVNESGTVTQLGVCAGLACTHPDELEAVSLESASDITDLESDTTGDTRVASMDLDDSRAIDALEDFFQHEAKEGCEYNNDHEPEFSEAMLEEYLALEQFRADF